MAIPATQQGDGRAVCTGSVDALLARLQARITGLTETEAAQRLAAYGPNDPACCPSSSVDTTYTWDAVQGTLVAGEPVSTPTGEDDGSAGVHERLVQDGFFEVMGGP